MPRERYKHGRHTPAFVLLFLAQEPAYGLTLFNKMQELIPYNKIDSAAIYRALQELEKDRLVESFWDTTEPGPAKKWYKIADKGFDKLAEYKEDIEMRINHLQFFLQTYREILNRKGDDM